MAQIHWSLTCLDQIYKNPLQSTRLRHDWLACGINQCLYERYAWVLIIVLLLGHILFPLGLPHGC